MQSITGTSTRKIHSKIQVRYIHSSTSVLEGQPGLFVGTKSAVASRPISAQSLDTVAEGRCSRKERRQSIVQSILFVHPAVMPCALPPPPPNAAVGLRVIRSIYSYISYIVVCIYYLHEELVFSLRYYSCPPPFSPFPLFLSSGLLSSPGPSP